MRYYSVVITDPKTGNVVRPAAFADLKLPFTYGSLVNGQTLGAALNVELDIPVAALALPAGDSGAFLRVWGISLQEIAQANDLTNKLISVYGGMARGLPLATAAQGQAGLLVSGYVFQAFGNWIGTAMTLDIVIYAGDGPNGLGDAANPRNLVLNWKAGTQLGDAIKSALSTAFPTLKQNVSISPNLVLTSDQVGYFQTASQFAKLVKLASAAIVGGTYPGVDILLTQSTFNVYDGTATKTPTQIKFQDLIGQPTWIASPQIQVTTMMRSDIHVGDYIKLPPSLTTNTAQGLAQFRNSSVFQGNFQVTQVRHVGNYRQPDASAWATTIDAAPVTQ